MFKKIITNLINVEFLFLALMIISLPSIEAPKNIFLVFFVIVATIRQVSVREMHFWGIWDWIFLSIITSALLSTVFAGLPHHEEWRGFRVLLTYMCVGWLVSRSNYTNKQISWLFGLTVIGVIPPLIWGCWQYLFLHTKPDLQLHSVGHVNHSAIYLTMIFVAMLGATLSLWKNADLFKRLLLALIPIVLYVGLIIGASRAAVGVGFIAGAILILLLSQARAMKWFSLSLLLVISMSTIVLNTGVVQKQVANQKNHDVLSARGKIWNISLEAATFSPVLGIGMSNWHFITPGDIKKSVEARHEVYDPSQYYFSPGHSHNLYLTVLAERGLLGISIFMFFMFSWMRQLVKTFFYTKKSSQAAYLWSGSFGAWMATFGIGFVNTTFHHEHAILACLLLGFYLTYCRINKILLD